jgi:hypothetical protein
MFLGSRQVSWNLANAPKETDGMALRRLRRVINKIVCNRLSMSGLPCSRQSTALDFGR